MKAVVLADNHTDYDFETPEGDLLIHCGDFTFHGNPKEMEKFKNYLKEFVYRVKPKYHFFGHNHAGAGVYNNDDTLFINAAILTEHYKKCRPPIVVNL